jgi:hypothetical protein
MRPKSELEQPIACRQTEAKLTLMQKLIQKPACTSEKQTTGPLSFFFIKVCVIYLLSCYFYVLIIVKISSDNKREKETDNIRFSEIFL